MFWGEGEGGGVTELKANGWLMFGKMTRASRLRNVMDPSYV